MIEVYKILTDTTLM